MKRITFLILDITNPGGTERSLINTCNSLAKSGYDILILSVYPLIREPFYEIDSKVKVESLFMDAIPTCVLKKAGWFTSLIVKLNKFVLTSNISILLATSHNLSIVLPFTKVKLKYACEHVDFRSIPLFSRLFMRITYPLLSGVIVLSKSAFNKTRFLNNNIRIIPNSLSFTSERKPNFQNKKILMVGRISPEKGYDRMIKIASKLKEVLPLWHIEIFGSGDLTEINNLKSELLKLNLSDYVIIKPPTSDIKDEYENSSIYMMTSYNEAFPMVLLEAMTCSLPIVAFENEGTSEIIKDGENGFLVKSNDYDDFIQKVYLLSQEGTLYEYISRGAKKKSHFFSEKHIIPLWEKLFF